MKAVPDKVGKKVFFVSDFHFGVPDRESSLIREKHFISFLDSIEADALEIFLMGDLFDFWFEYMTVVPKGFIRLLGKLAALNDRGIPVHLFRGNHDIWAFDYLEREAGVVLHREPELTEIMGKKFFLLHGDGVGPGDHGYKFIKKVFECRLNQWLFRWLHPDWGTRLGLYFSRRSRVANMAREGKTENGPNYQSERLYRFCADHHKTYPDVDYYVMGHRHRPFSVALEGGAQCVVLGDWISHFSYASFDGEVLELRYFGRQTL